MDLSKQQNLIIIYSSVLRCRKSVRQRHVNPRLALRSPKLAGCLPREIHFSCLQLIRSTKMGFFKEAAAKVGAKVPRVVKEGAKQAQKGKSGFAVNAFAKAGQNARKGAEKKR
jgi:hypothetical protein